MIIAIIIADVHVFSCFSSLFKGRLRFAAALEVQPPKLAAQISRSNTLVSLAAKLTAVIKVKVTA